MSWRDSLIKLATYDVEVRQQQLSEIMGRLVSAETRMARLVAEGEAEAGHAVQDAEAGWYHIGYAQGLKVRKATLQLEIDVIRAEERGARDALAAAFEEQKKYEQVAENARTAAAQVVRRKESAELDEVGMRAAQRKAS